MGLITIFSGWDDSDRSQKNGAESCHDCERGRCILRSNLDLAAAEFLHRFGARVVDVEEGVVVIEVPMVNFDLAFRALLTELGVMRYRVFYRRDPL